MDLLGNLGTDDQLVSARAELAVLQDKVKELTDKVRELSVENQSLLAEVEIYRNEAALPSFSKLALGQNWNNSTTTTTTDPMSDGFTNVDDFIKSGNGVYPSVPEITLENLHGHSNNLSCTLSSDDTILATGGADGSVSLVSWGVSLNPSISAQQVVKEYVSHVFCDAPVICLDFAKNITMGSKKLVAAGCMDGSVHFISARPITGGRLEAQRLQHDTVRHDKYVKSVKWSPREPIVATASADGTINIIKVHTAMDNSRMDEDDDDEPAYTATMETTETLHLPGPIESLCFSDDGNQLYCYARGTPFLTIFDLQQDCAITKMNLNAGVGSGAFDDHVSFSVMDMDRHNNSGGKYLVLATDTSRNIVMDVRSHSQVRNLYGHSNDGFSTPKVAFSQNGQYVLGNTQESGAACVWDIASSRLVERLENRTGSHTQPIRDLYSSSLTDTMVTTSFDKKTTFWFTPNM